MATTLSSPPSASTRTGAPSGYSLKLVVILGFLGAALAGGVAQILSGNIIPPEMGFVIGGLLGAGLIALPWRWSMLIPLALSVLGIVGPLSTGFPQYALTHPSEHIPFTTLAIQYTLLTLCAGVCVVMLTQALRRETIHPPRWLTPAISALLGLALGALLVGATAQLSGSGSAASAGAAGTETVHLTPSAFSPNIIALHTGDTLTVVDDSPTPHILANGAWSASNQEQPGAESGAPTINNVEVNNNTVTLGPFTTPGTYHIFCTVHPGMNLTVIVQ